MKLTLLALICCLTLCRFALAQEVGARALKRNTLFTQVGLGKFPSYGPPSIISFSLNYERLLKTTCHGQLGGQLGFGTWGNGDIYNDSGVSGIHAPLVVSLKYSLGKSIRHFLFVEGGYIFFLTDKTGELADPVKQTYHLPTATLGYQYHAKKSLYIRAGFSTWQALHIGIGGRFNRKASSIK